MGAMAPLLNQELQVAIDCSLIERRHRPLTGPQDVFHTQRAILVEEGLPDRSTVGCPALHESLRACQPAPGPSIDRYSITDEFAFAVVLVEAFDPA